MDLVTQNIGLPTGYAGWQVLSKSTPTDFKAFTSDPVLNREIGYFEQNAPKATTAQSLLKDPRLQDFVLTAFGLSSQSGATALMTKVLNSDPKATTSFAIQLANPHFKAIANAFNYGGASTPGTAAVVSSANVMTLGLQGKAGQGFQSFSGSFGGITLANVDLSGATTPQAVASVLQGAFQRADGNSANITVTTLGSELTFKDAAGRGTATSFNWQSSTSTTTASAPVQTVTGSPAVVATGGPNVTNSKFISTVVAMYTQAQFQSVVGNSSNTLREALYAQQQLPGITNWYSVMADPPLASVVQTALGLPADFGKLNVDQQNAVLQSKMPVADLQNPAKVSNLLNKFVAISDEQSSDAVSQSPAVQLLANFNASGPPAIINLTLPGAGGNTLSSGSMAGLVLSTSTG